MNRSIFQHARFQPAPNQADQARIRGQFCPPNDITAELPRWNLRQSYALVYIRGS
jgi:hypothetical protein